MTKKVDPPDPKDQWERRDKEPGDAHAAFRIFRDLPPGDRSIAKVARAIRKSEAQTRRWAKQWDWWERCAAWDDVCYKTEDGERLAAIEAMHKQHQEAGDTAVKLALEALNGMKPDELTGPAAVRLLEFGIKLQRSYLTDAEDEEADDPWEAIARELDPRAVT